MEVRRTGLQVDFQRFESFPVCKTCVRKTCAKKTGVTKTCIKKTCISESTAA